MKLSRDAVRPELWAALETGAVLHVRSGEARFQLTGKGALTCLQGLVTCDVEKAVDGSRSYGALLTAKGMIVSPLRIHRHSPHSLMVEAPASAAPLLEEVLGRSLPPRLCRWENLTTATTGLGLYGPKAASLAFPGAAPAVVRGAVGIEGDLSADAADMFAKELVGAGAVRATDELMEACRIFAGIPALGAEIDDKTLPQEVRFDELGAVSYTKGCYLGQETVARVHFRGHPNRRLVFLVLDAEPGEPPVEVRLDDKAVGRLTSVAWNAELDTWAGAAVLRREVEDGATVQAGETTAVVRTGRWPREP